MKFVACTPQSGGKGAGDRGKRTSDQAQTQDLRSIMEFQPPINISLILIQLYFVYGIKDSNDRLPNAVLATSVFSCVCMSH